jgi:hypothetical protein
MNYVLGSKVASSHQDEEYEEDTSRGSLRELDDNLRSELNNLQPSSSFDDDEEDESLQYFKKLALED